MNKLFCFKTFIIKYYYSTWFYLFFVLIVLKETILTKFTNFSQNNKIKNICQKMRTSDN